MSVYDSLWDGTNSKFEISKSKNGKFYWTFKGGNHEVVCTSEMYEFKQGAERGIQALKDNINAQVEDNTKQAA